MFITTGITLQPKSVKMIRYTSRLDTPQPLVARKGAVKQREANQAGRVFRATHAASNRFGGAAKFARAIACRFF